MTSVEEVETIAVRMVFSVAGVGQANSTQQVSPQKAAELVSAHAARFVDPPEVAPIFAEDLEPPGDSAAGTADGDKADGDAAAEGVTGDGGSRARTRESRPRASTSARAGSGGTQGDGDNPQSAEPGEGNLTG